MTYSLQDAKAKFSELVTTCLAEGPQTVTRHGQNAVVVVPFDDYQRLVAPKQSLGSFLRSAPRAELQVVRSRELGRQVSFE
ncbi:MAG: type II toxin-antitoxin system Phd/YefM family antitoxin [Spirochaetales bacterium]